MKGTEVLVLTRARFAELDFERLTAVRSRVLAVIQGAPGFLSYTVWEKVDDPFAFLIIGHFETEEQFLAAWDVILRSPVMEVVNDLLVEAPNTLRFSVEHQAGLRLESTHEGHFCSISTRIADIGYGQEVLDELKLIFEELRLIPGFLGYLTGRMVEIEDEILGLALWTTPDSYRASLPKKATYKIDLYSRVS